MDRKRNLTGNLQIITREALASLELKYNGKMYVCVCIGNLETSVFQQVCSRSRYSVPAKATYQSLCCFY